MPIRSIGEGGRGGGEKFFADVMVERKEGMREKKEREHLPPVVAVEPAETVQPNANDAKVSANTLD